MKTQKERQLDSPAEFDALPPEKQAALLAWIAQVMRPSRTFGRHNSYTVKHAAEEVLGYTGPRRGPRGTRKSANGQPSPPGYAD